MIIGKVMGRPLHGFCIRGHMVFVVRSGEPGGLCAYEVKTGALAALAPAGKSYHQAALEAVSKLEAGRFRYKEEA